ncbi:MAG: DUF898 family protein [Pseudolabrys sp.]
MTSGDGEETVAIGAVRFLGARRNYWRLLVRGAVLLILTLGIYRFWLMTDVRRFLWTNTEIAGESLEYAGTALELLLGFLVAVALLIPLYAGFFVGALELGPVGQVSGLIAFLALFLLGQYAIYRARRYRLTRTVYRGLRFHQSGSAWGYAFRAVGWWALTILTFGLAYPFQLASLERYKMTNTWYGDLAGRFEGRGIGLLLRGFPIWLLVIGPLLLTVYTFIDAVNWQALADTLNQGGDDMMARLEGSNSGFGMVVAFAMLMGSVAVTAAALLYPAFQAIVLRWWASGLRFGDIELRSKLRMRDVYGAYARFLGYALAFSAIVAIAALPALATIGRLTQAGHGTGGELAAIAVLLVGYVIVALGFSTAYRATVLLSLWQLVMESLHLSGLTALERVKATGRASSALGEGLADALNVGGY